MLNLSIRITYPVDYRHILAILFLPYLCVGCSLAKSQMTIMLLAAQLLILLPATSTSMGGLAYNANNKFTRLSFYVAI
jgi:hypothetical protein